MKQVVQDIRKGHTKVVDIPAPVATPRSVVVATVASLISAGTERYVVELARKSLIGKARQRPDHVARVLQKFKQEGVLPVLTQVRAKLDEPMPLGYSSAGIVLAVGRGVENFKPGDRVAAAAPHSGVTSTGHRLCAHVPDNVPFEQAAYTSVAAIAMQGVRQAHVNLGERVLVIGLGLVGQVVVALLKANGCRVMGTDLNPATLDLALTMGADEVALVSDSAAIQRFAGDHGVDAAIIAAATDSNGPIDLAADICRPRGRVVLVGVAGLNIPRAPFYAKELEFTVSSSLGPGRDDPMYAERGIDYPIGHARWTVQRNMRAALELMESGALPVGKLTTHRFDLQDAGQAYDLITSGDEPFCGVVLDYEPPTTPIRRVDIAARRKPRGKVGVGVIGAGNFARLVMVPTIRQLPTVDLRGICSARGMSAAVTGGQSGFAYACTDSREVLEDESVDAVFLLTRHDLHADAIHDAVSCGKHVFVEKPLTISEDDLRRLDHQRRELGDDAPIVMVGFNRRFTRATRDIIGVFAGIAPLSIQMRMVTADLPADLWVHDPDVGGGRIVGEACHAIDTCVAIAGSPPVKVFAESVQSATPDAPTADRVFITLRHANGAITSISYQAGGARSGPKERLEVFGGGTTAICDDWGVVHVWDGGGHRKLKGARDKGHAAEVESFVDAIRRNKPAPISWDDTLGVTWASLMAARSVREGVAFYRYAEDDLVEDDEFE